MVVTAVRAFLIDGYMAVVGIFKRAMGEAQPANTADTLNPYCWYSCLIWLDCGGGSCKQESGAGMRGTQKILFEWLSDLSLVFTYVQSCVQKHSSLLAMDSSHKTTEQHPSWNYWDACDGGMWFRQRCCVQLASWWSDYTVIFFQ